uniref:Uncharacterized protein n=1 Tax=Rhizophora mucronata TaxID=61149 RepID=A0A2P2QXW0_RHIMU
MLHIRLSCPRPKTKKLHGDFFSKTFAVTEISLSVCCGVMVDVEY